MPYNDRHLLLGYELVVDIPVDYGNLLPGYPGWCDTGLKRARFDGAMRILKQQHGFSTHGATCPGNVRELLDIDVTLTIGDKICCRFDEDLIWFMYASGISNRSPHSRNPFMLFSRGQERGARMGARGEYDRTRTGCLLSDW